MKESKDALTIHLYRYEEVLSSLRWSILSHNYTEGIFWALELYDSNMMEDVFETLFELWIDSIGFAPSGLSFLEYMVSIQASTDRDTFIKAIYTWCRIESLDTSILQVLLRGYLTPSSWIPHFPHSQTYSDLPVVLTDCLKRGKTTEAWLIARAINPEIQWKLLEIAADKLLRTATFNSIKSLDVSDCRKRAACTLLVCLSEASFIITKHTIVFRDLPIELSKKIEEWDSEESLKKRRGITIRGEALLYTCQRSQVPCNQTISQDIEYNFEANIMKSPCWQTILEDYQQGGNWKSDRYKEMFYDTYFPAETDDIPDEWSIKDKHVSHGNGLGKSPEAALRLYINAMLRNKSCIGVWNAMETIGSYSIPSLDWNEIYSSLRCHCSELLEANLPFKPIKKLLQFA